MSGGLRLCAAAAVVALGLAVGAETMSARPVAARAPQSAGHFAVSVKQLELAKKWGQLWSRLHPGQRAFIGRSLFVRCMSKRRILSPKPSTIKAIATSTVRAPIPGVTKRRVRLTAVQIRLDHGDRAPSQTLTKRVVRVRGSWYWITTASSRKAFIKINFC